MILSEITSYLKSLIPLGLQENYDNSGLLIGLEETEINGVLICLDVTCDILDEAIEKKCNLCLLYTSRCV